MANESIKESEVLEKFLKFLRDCESELKMAQEDLSDYDKETQDILHRLELCDDNYRNTALIAKLLRGVRKKRRIAKDRIANLIPIKEWITNNQAAIRSLEALLGESRKVERSQQIRIYLPRTNILKEFDPENVT